MEKWRGVLPAGGGGSHPRCAVRFCEWIRTAWPSKRDIPWALIQFFSLSDGIAKKQITSLHKKRTHSIFLTKCIFKRALGSWKANKNFNTSETWVNSSELLVCIRNRVRVCCESPTQSGAKAMVQRGAESPDDGSFYQLLQVAGASGLSEKLSIGTQAHFTLNNARLSIFFFVNCEKILLWH